MSCPALHLSTAEAGGGPRDRHVARAELSTDYLNRYGEALMLLEMVVMDPAIVDDLEGWRPAGYVQHFTSSDLRCAPLALAAYQALDPLARGAFEALCNAMNRLVETAVLTLRELPDPASHAPVIDMTALAFRNLLARATAFINSGGDMAMASYDTTEVQDTIDRLMQAA